MISSIQSGPHGNHLAISGTLDAEGALALRPLLEGLAADASRNLALDISEVTYMDGSGIGALAFTFKRLAAHGYSLKVEGATGQPLALLRKLGLDRTLGITRPAPRRLGFAAALGLARAA